MLTCVINSSVTSSLLGFLEKKKVPGLPRLALYKAVAPSPLNSKAASAASPRIMVKPSFSRFVRIFPNLASEKVGPTVDLSELKCTAPNSFGAVSTDGLAVLPAPPKPSRLPKAPWQLQKISLFPH